MALNQNMLASPSKLAKVATACAVMSLNEYTGSITSLTSAVELTALAEEGIVRLPIKKVGYEFTQV